MSEKKQPGNACDVPPASAVGPGGWPSTCIDSEVGDRPGEIQEESTHRERNLAKAKKTRLVSVLSGKRVSRHVFWWDIVTLSTFIGIGFCLGIFGFAVLFAGSMEAVLRLCPAIGKVMEGAAPTVVQEEHKHIYLITAPGGQNQPVVVKQLVGGI